MKTAIACAIVIALLFPSYMLFMYTVISVVASVIKNIGKDEFKSYGQPLDFTYAKLQKYDSFKDMIKGGISMSLRMGKLGFVIILLVFIYVEMSG